MEEQAATTQPRPPRTPDSRPAATPGVPRNQGGLLGSQEWRRRGGGGAEGGGVRTFIFFKAQTANGLCFGYPVLVPPGWPDVPVNSRRESGIFDLLRSNENVLTFVL